MPIVSIPAGRKVTSTYSNLKVRVARVVGGILEPEMLAAAGEFLNDAIIEFNSRLYECNLIGPVTLTATGGIATLPSAFYKEQECAVLDSAGNRLRQLEYKDWAEWQHTFNMPQLGMDSLVGGPQYYTVFNGFLTGQLRLLPERTVGDTATDSIRITYYRRFSLLANDTDALDAPEELQRALVLMAQSDMLRVFKANDPNASITHRALADRAWDRFTAIDMKHPDKKFRFRLSPLSVNRYPGFYIKV